MLKLALNPTFWAEVKVSIPGEKKQQPIKIKFTHRTYDQYKKFIETLDGKSDVEIFLDIAQDWEGIDAPFNKENVETLLQNYHGLCLEVFKVYGEEYTKARVKN